MKKFRFVYLSTVLMIFSCTNNSIPFDSEKWRNWEENESNAQMRLDMANDLIKNHNIIGKSTSEIEKLLGKPLNESHKELREMRYDIGPCRGFGIAYGILVITFKEDKVIEIDKYCH